MEKRGLQICGSSAGTLRDGSSSTEGLMEEQELFPAFFLFPSKLSLTPCFPASWRRRKGHSNGTKIQLYLNIPLLSCLSWGNGGRDKAHWYLLRHLGSEDKRAPFSSHRSTSLVVKIHSFVFAATFAIRYLLVWAPIQSYHSCRVPSIHQTNRYYISSYCPRLFFTRRRRTSRL
jgi:hypothetical protein